MTSKWEWIRIGGLAVGVSALLVVGLAAPAWAAGFDQIVLVQKLKTDTKVPVWRIGYAREGMEVWRGGGSWDLVKPYVVCLPQADTKVIVVDSDSYWRLITIVVAEGASKGCRGQVEFHDLEYRVTKTGERVRTPVPSYVGSNEVQPTPSKKKKGQ